MSASSQFLASAEPDHEVGRDARIALSGRSQPRGFIPPSDMLPRRDRQPVLHILGQVRLEYQDRVTSAAAPGPRARIRLLNSRRQETILALLALNLGKSVSTERLIDEVWRGEPPPRTSRQQIQNCTAAVRRTLRSFLVAIGHDTPQSTTIVTGANGYRLEAPRSSVDALVFEDSVRWALSEANSHNDGAVTECLSRALRLWVDTPLGSNGAVELRSHSVRLEELMLLGVEELANRELRLGRAPALLAAELRALTERHPFRERLWLLTMEALRRCGRVTEALERYRTYRDMLITEHGLEPSADMREKEREILRSID